MRIVTSNAALRDRPVGKHRLKISHSTLGNDARVRTISLPGNVLEPLSFEIVRRPIPLVDGPKAYQPK
jgi:hypothetical protein